MQRQENKSRHPAAGRAPRARVHLIETAVGEVNPFLASGSCCWHSSRTSACSSSARPPALCTARRASCWSSRRRDGWTLQAGNGELDMDASSGSCCCCSSTPWQPMQHLRGVYNRSFSPDTDHSIRTATCARLPSSATLATAFISKGE